MPSVITPCGGSGGGDLALLQEFDPRIPVTGYDFTSIVQTYKHLMLLLLVRSTHASPNVDDGVMLRFNNDSAANYSSEWLGGFGATAAAAESLAQTRGLVGFAAAVAAPQNERGAIVVWIPQYTSLSSFKHWISDVTLISGTTTGRMQRYALGGAWQKATPEALTRITITPQNGAGFESDSIASLYGLA